MAAVVTANVVRLLAVGAAVAVAVAVGTRQFAQGPENERPQKRGTADGFTTYAVPSASFTIAVPESWQAFTAEDVFGDSDRFDQLVRENPDLAAYRDALADPRSPVKLIAADPAVSSDFATNLNVIAQKAPAGYSFEDFMRESDGEIETISRRSPDLKRDVVSLPAGSAQRITYHAQFTLNGQARSVVTLQYGLVADGRVYILTYTTLPELEDDYADDFEHSAQSFQATA